MPPLMATILIPPSLPLNLKPPPLPSSSSPTINIVNAKKRASRRRSPSLRSLKQALSFAKSLTIFISQPPANPMGFLLLGNSGGSGGRGGIGFPTGGSSGQWWGKGRRGFAALVVASAAIAIFGVGERGELGRMIRVLVPVLIGLFKIRVWRRHHLIGIIFFVLFGFVKLREKKVRVL